MQEKGDEIINKMSNSKPIKKRVKESQDDQDSDDSDPFMKYSYDGTSSVGQNNSSLEVKARRDLFDYLGNKGIDIAKEPQKYSVNIKLNKNDRHDDNSRSDHTISYSGPNGEVYHSKNEVCEAIKSHVHRNTNTSHSTKKIKLHSDIVAKAKKNYESEVRDSMPIDVDGIKVISFGSIDPDNLSFHSENEILPIGMFACS